MSVAKRFIAKTILAKIYANDKCARRYYSPLPIVPHGPSDTSEWRRASRPKVPEYIKGLVHYEFAVEKDAQRILDFLIHHIIPSSPLFNSMGVKSEELIDLYRSVVERTLKDHCSLLGFNGDELIAVSLHSIKDLADKPKEPVINAEIIPSRDYGPEIDVINFKSRAARKVACFAKLMKNKFDRLLPQDSQKVMFIEIGGVTRSYRGRGISQEMVTHSMRLATDLHCDHICTVADSKSAQKMFEQKLGYRLLRELKLDHYLDGSTPVFVCDPDEVVSGKLLCKRL